MKVYGLIACGPWKHMDGLGQIVSKFAYRSRAAAECAKEDFKARCTLAPDGVSDAMSLNQVIDCKIYEFELED